MDQPPSDLLRTKLYRPRLAEDFIPRPRLLARIVAAAVVNGGGSGNLPMLRQAIALLVTGIRSPAVAAWWLAFFEASRRAFMGREIGSRIYGAWHVIAVLVVYRWALEHGHRELERAAGDWLRAWWVFRRLAGDTGASILKPPMLATIIGRFSEGKYFFKLRVILLTRWVSCMDIFLYSSSPVARTRRASPRRQWGRRAARSPPGGAFEYR